MPGVSLNPDTFQSGGFFEEGFYSVKEARFTREGPENYPIARTFARLTLAPEEGGEARIQYWSVAAPTDFVPSQDGRILEQVGRRVAPNDNSNFAELIRSYVNAGFNKSTITDDIGELFDGAVLYMILQDAPERAGLERTKPASAPDNWKPQIVVVGEIKQLPGVISVAVSVPVAPSQRGRAAQSTPRATTPTAPSAAPVAQYDGAGTADEVKGEVLSFLLSTLGAEGPLERGVITTRAMQTYGTDGRRAGIIGLLNNKEHLDSLVADGLITIQGTTIGLPEPA